MQAVSRVCGVSARMLSRLAGSSLLKSGLPICTRWFSIPHCSPHYGVKDFLHDSMHALLFMQVVAARAVCNWAGWMSKKLRLTFFEGRLAHRDFSLHTVPPLQRSSLKCCDYCKNCASFAMSRMEAQAVLQMAVLRFENIEAYFLQYPCWPCSKNILVPLYVCTARHVVGQQCNTVRTGA